MTAEQGVLFLQALRATNIRVKENGWIEASCVLARWTHARHHDQSPSFGLLINPGGRSRYQCFACRYGSAEELVQALELYTNCDPAYDFKLCHDLLQGEVEVLPLPEYASHPTTAAFDPWPQYWIDSFQKVGWVDPARSYLQHRQVPEAQWEQFDLRYDSKRQMIVAPYRDVFGRLAGARGRSVVPASTPEGSGSWKHHDYRWQGTNNCRYCWYNEEVLNLHGPVVVVEGQFDCWRVAQVFPKVVAALTAKPTWEKMKKLGDCTAVIQIPDRDTTGMASTQIYETLCRKLQLPYRVVWLDDGVKDPDEACAEYLADKIEAVL